MARGPKSKVSRLDPAIKAELDRLLFHEGRSIDDVVEYLQGLHLDDAPSRAAIGRYSASTQRMREDMARMRTVTAQLSKDFGAQDNATARFLMQLAQNITFKLMDKQSGDDANLEIADFMQLMKGLQHMATARKSTIDSEEKVLAKLKRETVKLIDAAAKDAADAGEKGLSAERLAQLRRGVLGVRIAGG